MLLLFHFYFVNFIFIYKKNVRIKEKIIHFSQETFFFLQVVN